MSAEPARLVTVQTAHDLESHLMVWLLQIIKVSFDPVTPEDS